MFELTSSDGMGGSPYAPAAGGSTAGTAAAGRFNAGAAAAGRFNAGAAAAGRFNAGGAAGTSTPGASTGAGSRGGVGTPAGLMPCFRPRTFRPMPTSAIIASTSAFALDCGVAGLPAAGVMGSARNSVDGSANCGLNASMVVAASAVVTKSGLRAGFVSGNSCGCW